MTTNGKAITKKKKNTGQNSIFSVLLKIVRKNKNIKK